ncbi:MAG: oligoendopeptidase F, partial [Clostridiales bacterium]
MKTIPLRKDVDEALTWDLSGLCKDTADFERQLQDCQAQAEKLKSDYFGKLDNAENLIAAIKTYADLTAKMTRLGTYSHMALDVDMANAENLSNDARFQTVYAEILSQLSFIESEAKGVAQSVLEKVKEDATCKGFVDEIIRNKPHMLGAEAEMVLKALTGNFMTPYKVYNQAKFVDLSYPDLELGDEKVPFDFVAFENSYDGTVDTATRRMAFALFSEHLAKYQNTFATALNAQMQQEKTIATLRGYDSVFDYLLFEQKVTREMYDRQIDRIVEDLAPAMRKYAKLLQDIYGLDKMTFADLKIPVDAEFEKKLSVAESKTYILDALSIYGAEYKDLLVRAYDERWIDFAFNQNKA